MKNLGIMFILLMLVISFLTPVHAQEKEEIPSPQKITFDSSSVTYKKKKYAFKENHNYFYSQLDESNKIIYQAIYQMAVSEEVNKKYTFQINDDHSSLSKRLYLCEFAVGLDHPELITYYMNLWSKQDYLEEDKEDPILACKPTYSDGKIVSGVYYTSSYTSYKKEEDELREKAQAFMNNNINTNEPPAVIAKEIHDQLINRVSYDNTAASSSIMSLSHSAYGALVNKRAVCDGYALAYEYLCKEAGIESCVVYGKVGIDQYWEEHAWNEVKLGNEWYEVDVTWDDQDDGTADYTYYNLTSVQMASRVDGDDVVNHQRDDETSDGTAQLAPTAKGTHFNKDYMVYNSYKLTDNKDPLGNQLNYYLKDTNTLLSNAQDQEEWTITIPSNVIWKVETTVSNNLSVVQNWNQGCMQIKRKSYQSGEAALYSLVYFDNGQRLELDETLSLPQLHKYGATYTVDQQPTCTSEGYESIHDIYDDSIQPGSTIVLPALGHEYGSWQKLDDEYDVQICKRDGAINKEKHHFDTGVISSAPTCKSTGTIVYTCVKCHASIMQALPALGHQYGPYQKENKYHIRYCLHDHNHYQRALHDYGKAKIIRKATYDHQGKKEFICKACGVQKYEKIPCLQRKFLYKTKKGWRTASKKINTKHKALSLKLQGSKGKVVWKASNRHVAKVKKGKVRFKKKGTVFVTAFYRHRKYRIRISYYSK